MKKSAIAVRTVNGHPSRTLLASDPVFVGRDPECDVRLQAGEVSGRHVEIYRVGDLWWVRDLGSENGTFLDGDPIEAAPVAGVAMLELGEGGPRLELTPVPAPLASDSERGQAIAGAPRPRSAATRG